MQGTLEAKDLEALSGVARKLLETFQPGPRATVLALQGELGAGKTALAGAIARELGVAEPITSPTYVIEKVYQLSNQPFERLVHIDAYRLDSSDELRALGFSKLLDAPKTLIILEWPERVPELLPEDVYRVSIAVSADGARTFSFAYHDQTRS